MRPVFHTARQLGQITGATIYGVVSATRDAGKAMALRWQYVLYSVACGSLFVALAAAVIVGKTLSPLGFGAHN
jgi:hypothetical protein